MDYAEFADEFGADWVGRLQLVRFDECVVRQAREGCAAPVLVPR